MVLTYNKDKNFPDLKDQLIAYSCYGRIESFQDLRDELHCRANAIYLFWGQLGNFAFPKIFIGTYDEFSDYLHEECLEELEGGYLGTNFKAYKNLTEVKTELIG